MRKVSLGVLVIVLLVAVTAYAELTVEEKHYRDFYPVSRVNEDGSGTVIRSEEIADGIWSTYVLTNYHVIADKITIDKQWDPIEKKEAKVERLSKVSVEIFQYKDLSTWIGTLKVDAHIVAYSPSSYGRDLALLKLDLEKPVDFVATLLPKGQKIQVFAHLIAVGCALGWPPIPTDGILSRVNMEIPGSNYPFSMSSAQIIYGNSGGAMFLEETGEMVGVPARVPALGWGGSDPVPHMGCFIPIEVVYAWFDEIGFQFLYDPAYTEEAALKAKAKKEKEVQEKLFSLEAKPETL